MLFCLHPGACYVDLITPQPGWLIKKFIDPRDFQLQDFSFVRQGIFLSLRRTYSGLPKWNAPWHLSLSSLKNDHKVASFFIQSRIYVYSC